jgi:hypothetical protein
MHVRITKRRARAKYFIIMALNHDWSWCQPKMEDILVRISVDAKKSSYGYYEYTAISDMFRTVVVGVII